MPIGDHAVSWTPQKALHRSNDAPHAIRGYEWLLAQQDALLLRRLTVLDGRPPPESAAERRWFEENRSSPYDAKELNNDPRVATA